MDIVDVLALKDRGMIALVGAGGKTTTMYSLTEGLKARGHRVILTTTTGILNPREKGYGDYYFVGEIDQDFVAPEGSITVYGDRLEGDRLKGGDVDYLDRLYREGNFDFIVMEADGARRKPIKAPKDGEPVIPSLTSHTIGLIGLDSLGKPTKEIVHRPEYFEKIVGKERMELNLLEEDIARLVLADKGLFKEARGERLVLLNKADTKEKLESGLKIREILTERDYNGRVIVGNIRTDEFY